MQARWEKTYILKLNFINSFFVVVIFNLLIAQQMAFLVWGKNIFIKFRNQISLLVVPTFDTKVTEYLCSGGFFFLQTNFDFLTSHFWRNFLYHSEAIVVLSSNLKRYFTCDHFFVNYEGLKIAILAILTNLGQLTRDIIRAINV